uniref:Putative lectin/glucanase superfamily protein n=1 Tax=viral metagenome TaxID=1070528 RepID=A0A6M3KK59_9ZZZZ
MRSPSSAVQSIIDAEYKDAQWLITVTTLAAATTRWSSAAISYDGENWDAKVIKDSFAGIELSRSRNEFGIQAPNQFNFEITDSGNVLTASDYEGATVQVDLIVSDGSTDSNGLIYDIALSWKMRCRRCYSTYQRLTFVCEDFLQEYLKGDYPDTSLVSALSESAKGDPDDNLCVPIPFGDAYIPLRSAYITGDARYYVLGTSSGVTYSISEITCPRDLGFTAIWTAADGYAFTQATKTLGGASMRVFSPIIADADLDGDADAAGFWQPGEYILDPRVRFTRSDTATMTGPEDIFDFVLQGIGIPSADIDNGSNGSFSSAGVTYAGWGLEWNGGLYYREQKQAILARMCTMCHSVLDITDKIELRPLSATSVMTIDKSCVRRDQFSVEPILEIGSDSAYIAIPVSDSSGTRPQDELKKILVSALDAGTTSNTASETLEMPWVQDTQHAQALGTLYFQRKFRGAQRIRFLGHSKCMVLQPDDVITIDHVDYGGTYDVLVDKIKINRDLSVEIEAIRFIEALLDWDDLAPSATSWADDTTTGMYQTVISGPDGTVTSGGLNNIIRGRIRLVSGDYEIHFDPTDPAIKFYDLSTGTILRAAIGKVESGIYGIAFYDILGQETIVIDATRKVIKEMEYEIYNAGIIRTNTDIQNNGGWAVGPTQQIAYNSSGDKRFQVVFSGTDQGDFYFGGYDDGLCGLKGDMSAGQAWFRGDLAIESLPGFPRANNCYLDVPFTEMAGTVAHDEGRVRKTGTLYNSPAWTSGGPLGYYLTFAGASSQYVDFGINANWDYVAPGYDMSWSFWIRVTGVPAANDIFFGKGAYQVGGWRFFLTTAGKVSLEINKSGGDTYATTTNAIPYNQWNHVVFIYDFASGDAGTVDIYINGVFDKTVSSVVTMASGAAYSLLMGATNGPTSYFDGGLTGIKFFHYLALTADNVKALYKYPQGIRGGQVTARSLYVGTPSGSAPGTKIDDTGIWAYGASGAQLFGFCTIASGTVTWNSQTLSAGHFVLGDYNGASGVLYNGNFSIKVSASDTIAISGGALNISAGSHNWSGGAIDITGTSININGGSLAITSGLLSISSTGSFSMTGGTFEIAGGTVSISAVSGLTIAAASKMTVNSTGGIYFSTVGRLYVSSTTMYLSTQSATQDISIFSHDYLGLTATGTMAISGAQLRVNCNIYPNVNNTYYLGGDGGGTNYYWAGLYAWTVYYGATDAYPWDDEDDIALVRAIQPIKNQDGTLWRNKAGKLVYDQRTFPRGLTNIDNLYEIISEKYHIEGMGITAQDISAVLDGKKSINLPDGLVIDREEISKHIFTNANRMSGFQLSIHRKLIEKIDLLENEIQVLKDRIQ